MDAYIYFHKWRWKDTEETNVIWRAWGSKKKYDFALVYF